MSRVAIAVIILIIAQHASIHTSMIALGNYGTTVAVATTSVIRNDGIIAATSSIRAIITSPSVIRNCSATTSSSAIRAVIATTSVVVIVVLC